MRENVGMVVTAGLFSGSPRLLSLQIVGTMVEGSTLAVDKKYWGGKEGDSVFRWFRVSPFESIYVHLSPGLVLQTNDLSFLDYCLVLPI